jgi:antibiotic biosynthesis monooxygenase (ABM) superfamily enzyme
MAATSGSSGSDAHAPTGARPATDEPVTVLCSLFTFPDRNSLRAWLDSPERRRWLAPSGRADRGRPGAAAADRPGDLVQAARLQRAHDEATAPLKMWLVPLVAVYPLVLAFQALVVPRMAGLPLPLSLDPPKRCELDGIAAGQRAI